MELTAIKEYFKSYPLAFKALEIAGIVLLCIIAYYITKKIIISIIKVSTKKTKADWDDIIVEKKVFDHLAWLVPAFIVYQFAYIQPAAELIIKRVVSAFMVFVFIIVANSFLNAIIIIFNKSKLSKGRPIKGYVQVVKIVINIAGGIVVVALLFDKSPWVFLSGLGAMTAVLMLVFKDTILSLVASLQLSSNDMLKIGDWVEMPQFGADGDVIDIALHTVKIQNFDKTITTVPTHKLIEGSFKNWRGMSDSGGRRIKRSIVLDMKSVKFLTPEMTERLKKIHFLKDYIKQKEEELKKFNAENNIDESAVVNGRRLTNVGTFRAYLVNYLKNNPNIHKDMTLLVRQLAPSPVGLPIELYIFTTTTAWVNYEAIQADIFDHILAVLNEFELLVYQNPTGYDFQKLAK